MGLNLCGASAWNKLTTILSGATGITRTQKVSVKGKVKCPCGCNHEFEAEIVVEQKVQGGVIDFDVEPVTGFIELCPWKM